MKNQWLTLGFNAQEICSIDDLINFNNGEIIPYIHDIHFAHYDAKLLPSGRMPTQFNKKEAEYFLKTCLANGINTTLLLNSGNYVLDDIIKILENFYLPLGVSSLVILDKNLATKLKVIYPELEMQGSCISYIDTIEGLLEEDKCGIKLHNPATWTIRDMSFIKKVNESGLKQKQIMSEGCKRKCKLELWHRKEVMIGNYHGLNETCKKSFSDIYTLLMGSWITIKQLKRMENYIDVLKLPRNTFDSFSEIYRFINLYNSNEPYNILDFFATPLAQIKYDNIIMSDVFDDAFFDNTISDSINKEFLDQYVCKLDKIPFFIN